MIGLRLPALVIFFLLFVFGPRALVDAFFLLGEPGFFMVSPSDILPASRAVQAPRRAPPWRISPLLLQLVRAPRERPGGRGSAARWCSAAERGGRP